VAQRRVFFDMQITAEWGKENRCQFVSQIFLNLPNCLYLQKVCDFFQSYIIIFKVSQPKPTILQKRGNLQRPKGIVNSNDG